MKIAIVGTGIAGLSAAWLLHKHHDVTLYERHEEIGGHATTAQIDGHPPIDMGFMLYNPKTYPNFVALLDTLGIESDPVTVTFGGSLHDRHVEYSQGNLFARFKNRINPRFLMMTKDLGGFYAKAEAYLNSKKPNMPLGLFLKKGGYSKGFAQDYLMPIGRGLWNLPPGELKKFPVRHFLRLLKNNGFLSKLPNAGWMAIRGGSCTYIDRLAADLKPLIKTDTAVVSIYRRANGVEVTDKNGNMGTYDILIMACHADQSLRLMQDASPKEKEVLGAFTYVQSKTYLHTDKKFMPKSKSVWSAWNFMSRSTSGPNYMSFWMNKLQPWLAKEKTNYFLSVNPPETPDGVLQESVWHHPSYSRDSLQAWKELPSIQGRNRTWFCGAWCGYGLHEDALTAGLAIAEAIGPDQRPWDVAEISPAAANVTPVRL